MTNTPTTGVSRRTLAQGVAWATPAILLTTPAPATAVSLQKDPGINGWVENTARSQGGCSWTLEVDSTPSGTGPDGAPFGLYVYDVEDPNLFSQAKLTYWIIGDQNATWRPLRGHSNCWSGPSRGTPATKKDGLLYTPYTWTYTCPVLSSQRQIDPIDGVERLYLGDFHVRASFTQPRDLCRNVTYWTQRFITIDPDGAGPRPPEVHTFERRNGTLGTYRARTRSAQAAPASTDASATAHS